MVVGVGDGDVKCLVAALNDYTILLLVESFAPLLPGAWGDRDLRDAIFWDPADFPALPRAKSGMIC